MKQLLTLFTIIFLLIPLIGTCQVGNFGQTRQSIIKSIGDCKIKEITNAYLSLNCGNVGFFYRFDELTRLCNLAGGIWPISHISNFYHNLEINGFSLKPNIKFEADTGEKSDEAYCNGNLVCFIIFDGDYFTVRYMKSPRCP